MTFAAKLLNNGQIASSKGTIYTVPTGVVAYVNQVNLFNTGSNQETILVYLNPGGTSRVWKRFVLDENESAECMSDGSRILIEAGCLIEAQTTNGSVVDFFVMGVEETL